MTHEQQRATALFRGCNPRVRPEWLRYARPGRWERLWSVYAGMYAA